MNLTNFELSLKEWKLGSNIKKGDVLTNQEATSSVFKPMNKLLKMVSAAIMNCLGNCRQHQCLSVDCLQDFKWLLQFYSEILDMELIKWAGKKGKKKFKEEGGKWSMDDGGREGSWERGETARGKEGLGGNGSCLGNQDR